MSFDYTTLITDRTAADVTAVKALMGKPMEQWTEAETAAFLAGLKGSYNAGDLNRVSACMEDLVSRFRALGYRVPGYARVEVQRSTSRLPEGYTEVEYIQSSGTQYVDTGIGASYDMFMDIAFIATGSRGLMGHGGSKGYYCGIAASGHVEVNTEEFQTLATERNEIELVGTTTSLSVTVGGETITITRASAPTATFKLFGGVGDSYACHAKLYSCQIYDDDLLVRDYVPCINAGGEVGLYDLANGAFYANAGTGTFTAGAVVAGSSSESDADPYVWLVTDVPRADLLMEQVLGNMAAVRRVLAQAASTPDTPESMAGLTVDKANAIEQIMADLDTLLVNMADAWYYSGELYAGEV